MGLLARFRRRGADPLACQEFVELVTDYLEDALTPADHARFEVHLAHCDACTAYFASIRRTITSLHELPPAPTDPHARAVLLTAFRELRG